MNLLMTLTFVPVSAESTYRLSLHRRPLETSARLSWLAQVGDRRHKISLRQKVPLTEDDTLADFECYIDVTIDQPFDGKDSNKPWDYAHGLLQWVGGSQPYLIRLVVPAETFASLTDLAERGNLPALEIHCIPGHGLEDDGPYGDMKWDTTGDQGPVPVKHIQFIYSFSADE